MVCHLFGAKPLSELMLGYCKLNYWEQISVKFRLKKDNYFDTRKCLLKFRLQTGESFVSASLLRLKRHSQHNTYLQ